MNPEIEIIKFVINWDPEKSISAKTSSSKQLVPTNTTYELF